MGFFLFCRIFQGCTWAGFFFRFTRPPPSSTFGGRTKVPWFFSLGWLSSGPAPRRFFSSPRSGAGNFFVQMPIFFPLGFSQPSSFSTGFPQRRLLGPNRALLQTIFVLGVAAGDLLCSHGPQCVGLAVAPNDFPGPPGSKSHVSPHSLFFNSSGTVPLKRQLHTFTPLFFCLPPPPHFFSFSSCGVTCVVSGISPAVFLCFEANANLFELSSSMAMRESRQDAFYSGLGPSNPPWRKGFPCQAVFL